jgi:hypothetical protein
MRVVKGEWVFIARNSGGVVEEAPTHLKVLNNAVVPMVMVVVGLVLMEMMRRIADWNAVYSAGR